MNEVKVEGWFCWLQWDREKGLRGWEMKIYPLPYRELKLLKQHPEVGDINLSVCGSGQYVSVTCERIGAMDEVREEAEKELSDYLRSWLAGCAASLDKMHPGVPDNGE